MRQHASAYVSIRQHKSACASIRQHTPAYVSVRQRTSAYGSIRQHGPPLDMPTTRKRQRACEAPYVSIRQHTSAYVSMRQHASHLVDGDVPALEWCESRQRVSVGTSCTYRTLPYVHCTCVSAYAAYVDRAWAASTCGHACRWRRGYEDARYIVGFGR